MSEEKLKDEIEKTEEKVVENNVNEKNLNFSQYLDKLFKTDNLFEKISVGIMSVIILGFIYSLFRLIGVEDIESLFGYISAQKFIRFFVFLQLFVIILMIIKLVYNKKDIKEFMNKGNILMSLGTLSVVLGTLSINKLVRIVDLSKKAMNSSGLFDNIMNIGAELISFAGTDVEKFVKNRVIFTTVFHSVGIILFVVAIIFVLKNFSKNETINKLTETIDKKVGNVVNTAKNIDKEEVGNSVKETAEKIVGFLQKFKKQIIIGVSVVGILIASVFGFKIVKDINTPDAIISLKEIDVTARFIGNDKKGKINVEVNGRPKISEVKNPKKSNEIYSEVSDYEVVIDKETNLKNGDEVKVVVKYKQPTKFKLKYDATEIEKTFIVSDLKEVVLSFSDIPKSQYERIDKKVAEAISKNIWGDYRNIEIKKLKTFEKEMYNNTNNDYFTSDFNLIYMYKVSYETKRFFSDKYEKKELLELYIVKNFDKKGENLDFYVFNNKSVKFEESEIEDLANRLKIKGYKEVK